MKPTTLPAAKVLVILGEKFAAKTVPVKFIEVAFLHVDILCASHIELKDVSSVNFADGFTASFIFGAELFNAVEPNVGAVVSAAGGVVSVGIAYLTITIPEPPLRE